MKEEDFPEKFLLGLRLAKRAQNGVLLLSIKFCHYILLEVT